MTEPATWEEVEKEVALIDCLIRRLPEDERCDAAVRIAMNAALFAGDNFYEALGVLEEAKIQFRECWENIMVEEEEEQN